MRIASLFVLLVAVCVVSMTRSTAAHAGNSDPAIVHACMDANNGQLRVVSVDGACRQSEVAVHWSIVGTAGPQGPSGLQGERGPQGPPATNPEGPCFDTVNRIVDCGNGTITDTVTGLIWLKDAGCLGSSNWPGANSLAAGLADGQCGLTDGSKAGDWRLPSMAEWKATMARAVQLGCILVNAPSFTNDPGTDCLKAGPSSLLLPNQDNNFWSSSSGETFPFFAFNAYPGDGISEYLSDKGGTLQVWPVRGQSR